MMQRKARFWTLMLMVITATVVLSSPKEKSESALADRAEPDAITNSIGMKLVLIPAGDFLMGAEEDQDATKGAFPYVDPACWRAKGRVTRCASRSRSTWGNTR